jgi:Flp pilus assembly pilin Flp
MVKVLVWAQALVFTRSVARDDDGQATAEYALVLLGAAAVALLLVAWATRTNRIGRLVEFVLDQIVGRVT